MSATTSTTTASAGAGTAAPSTTEISGLDRAVADGGTPSSFADKLKVATGLRDANAAGFETLRGAGIVKTRTTHAMPVFEEGEVNFEIIERVAKKRAKDLLAAWRGPIKLTPIDDVFNAKLDYGVDSWTKLEALNADMLPVMNKYELLQQDNPKVITATSAFVGNYKAIAGVVSGMKATVAGKASVKDAAERDFYQVSSLIQKLARRHDLVIGPGPKHATGKDDDDDDDDADEDEEAHIDEEAEDEAGEEEDEEEREYVDVPPAMACIGVEEEHIIFLKEALAASGVTAPAFELLYQASEGGVTAADVLRKCKGKGPVVVIGSEEKKGWLFGGCMDCGIDDGESTADGQAATALPALQSFVFTLTNPHRLPPTAWRRAFTAGGVSRGSKEQFLLWNNTLATSSAASVLQWTTGNNDECYQSRGTRGCKVYTGKESWACSDVLIYRV